MLTGCIVIRAWSMAWSAYWTQFPLLINLHASQPPPPNHPPLSSGAPPPLQPQRLAVPPARKTGSWRQNILWVGESKASMSQLPRTPMKMHTCDASGGPVLSPWPLKWHRDIAGPTFISASSSAWRKTPARP